MRRLRPVAAIAVLILSGCGGSSSTESTTPTTTAPRAQLVKGTLAEPKGCFVSVFIADEARPAQVTRIERMLLSNPRVRTVAFVSKALALERLRRVQPDFVEDLGKHNPLPARFEVVPLLRADVFSIIEPFARGVPGVINVRPSSRCGFAPSLIPNG